MKRVADDKDEWRFRDDEDDHDDEVFDEEEEEDEEWARPALPVGEACGGDPEDGLQYLALVRREASHPRFLVTVAKSVTSPVAPRPPALPAAASLFAPLSEQEAMWKMAFGATFGGLRRRVGEQSDASSSLGSLRRSFRGVSRELSKSVFGLAAVLPRPLSDEARQDLHFFARKLAAVEDDDAARVALIAICARLQNG